MTDKTIANATLRTVRVVKGERKEDLAQTLRTQQEKGITSEESKDFVLKGELYRNLVTTLDSSDALRYAIRRTGKDIAFVSIGRLPIMHDWCSFVTITYNHVVACLAIDGSLSSNST